MKSIYICYADEDISIAEKIKDKLSESYQCCLIKKNNSDILVDQASDILNGIKSSDIFLLIQTNNINYSNWVAIQIIKAVSLNKTSVSIKCDNSKLSESLQFSLYNFKFYRLKDIEKNGLNL